MLLTHIFEDTEIVSAIQDNTSKISQRNRQTQSRTTKELFNVMSKLTDRQAN